MPPAHKSKVHTDGDTDDRDEAADETDVPTWVKPDQVDRLLDAVPDASPDYLELRDEALLLLTYDAGLRASEAVALDRSAIHLDGDHPYLLLDAEIQKGQARTVPLDLRPSLGTARTLRHYLRERERWKPDVAALFPSRSTRAGQSPHLTTEAFRNLTRKVAEAADVRPYRTEDHVQVAPRHLSPHSLRHGVFYREFVEGERRLKEVSLRLRHARVSTTEEYYAHLIRR